jgi:hypothetical protein
VREAAARLAREGILKPVLIGAKPAHAAEGLTYVDPAQSPRLARYAALYYERRRARGITQMEAAEIARIRSAEVLDAELKVAKAYDMLPEGAGDKAQGRTAADNATVRSVFVIGPNKKVRAMLTYPMSTGRNFDEILRLLDSCQLTAKHKVATPVNWKQGGDVIIVPTVSDADAKKAFPGGWRAPKPYLRIVPQPR